MKRATTTNENMSPAESGTARAVNRLRQKSRNAERLYNIRGGVQ